MTISTFDMHKCLWYLIHPHTSKEFIEAYHALLRLHLVHRFNQKAGCSDLKFGFNLIIILCEDVESPAVINN